ncbi:MAG TPA: universal stress protein, partial [Thermomicrobiales bacterium]|nr:universal stress protein [Thermomicrobiales bacterium]
MFQRIVAALDGSKIAEQTLPPATELARRLGVPLLLLRVADLTWLRLGMNDAALAYAALDSEVEEERRQAEAYLAAIAARLAAAGLMVTTDVRSGFAARQIVAAVQPGDMLVLASHGRSGLGRLLLGSVAEKVTREASVPALL